MSFFGKIFGSTKAVDAILSTADSLWETTEEKSKTKMLFLKLYEPFKLVQRLALIIVLPPFVFLHIVLGFTWIYYIWFPTSGELLDFRFAQLKEVAIMNNLTLGEPSAWILGFYFLGGAGEGIIKAWSARVRKQ